MKPDRIPIGLLLSQAAKAANRAFEAKLNEAGGSLPVWMILLSLMSGEALSQGDLAERVGIRGPTLTHHLNRMEEGGLLRRSRRPDNRRVHDVILTDAGRALFHQLRQAAAAQDARVRHPFSDEELELLRELLQRMIAATDPGSYRQSEKVKS